MTTPSTPELLSEMARLTALSNRISDVQIKNLQTFPFCYFDGIKEAKINYDLSHKSNVLDDPTNDKLIIDSPVKNLLVAYHLILDDKVENFHLEHRFNALEKSVRTLFWKDVLIEIYFGEKIVYKSKSI